MNFLILWEQIVSYYQDLTFYNIEVNALQLLGFVFAFGISSIAAITIAYFAKKRTGCIVDPIIMRGALSEKTAITAEEGGFASVRKLSMLTRGKMLRKTVCVVGDDANETAESVEGAEKKCEKAPKGKKKLPSVREMEAAAAARLMTCRFYIPEEKTETALRRFSGKRNSVLSLILSILLMAACAVGIYFLLPFILQLIDNFLTMAGGNE